MRERIRKWLFPSLEQEINSLWARVANLEKAIAVVSQPQPEKTAAEIMRPLRSFSVNRVPGRKLRAELEYKHSPEFKERQANEREMKAKQPRGAK